MQNDKFRPLPHTKHKNELKMVLDLNVRAKVTKLLEETLGENLGNVGLGQWFSTGGDSVPSQGTFSNVWKHSGEVRECWETPRNTQDSARSEALVLPKCQQCRS